MASIGLRDIKHYNGTLHLNGSLKKRERRDFIHLNIFFHWPLSSFREGIWRGSVSEGTILITWLDIGTKTRKSREKYSSCRDCQFSLIFDRLIYQVYIK